MALSHWVVVNSLWCLPTGTCWKSVPQNLSEAHALRCQGKPFTRRCLGGGSLLWNNLRGVLGEVLDSNCAGLCAHRSQMAGEAICAANWVLKKPRALDLEPGRMAPSSCSVSPVPFTNKTLHYWQGKNNCRVHIHSQSRQWKLNVELIGNKLIIGK